MAPSAPSSSGSPHLGVAKKKKKKREKSKCSSEEASGPTPPHPPKPYTDVIVATKSGKPVRRDGPKWEPGRITEETLYIKHPELFKYSGDQEDKEWLAKNQLMSTTGGK